MHDERRALDDAAADIAADELTVTVVTTMAAAEPHWRHLESEGVLTPYQRFDWLAPLLATGDYADRLAIAVIFDGARPVALLPLLIRSRFGIASAALLGADMGGVGWMPVARAAAPALTPPVLQRLLAEIGRQAGPLDLIILHSQPAKWSGVDNPLLAFPHQPAPDHFYCGLLSNGPGSKRLRNIMRGRRRLEEGFGPVALRRAETPEQVAAIHEVFLDQRRRRFEVQGISNVFGEERTVAFFRRAAEDGLGSDLPALRLHALYAGDEIVATSCGTFSAGHYSQYINSATDGPAAKSSLMGLLMHELTSELQADGITSLDMGIGDFDYKTDWTAPQTVYDSFVPLTVRGRLAAPLLRRLRGLRRAIKQNPKLFGLLRRLRALLRRPFSRRARP
jgi:CelD/BcsL family acetyltransferase involved in cellulose biosynthesis